jgi:hypothetical protein
MAGGRWTRDARPVGRVDPGQVRRIRLLVLAPVLLKDTTALQLR